MNSPSHELDVLCFSDGRDAVHHGVRESGVRLDPGPEFFAHQPRHLQHHVLDLAGTWHDYNSAEANTRPPLSNSYYTSRLTTSMLRVDGDPYFPVSITLLPFLLSLI